MGEAILAVVGVIVGAALGAAGGFLTARQQGRQAVELERLRAAEERRRQAAQLAVDIARIELERSPDNPYTAAEHVAVLTGLLRNLDAETESTSDRPIPVLSDARPDPMDRAVERIRTVYCTQCMANPVEEGGLCASCRAMAE